MTQQDRKKFITLRNNFISAKSDLDIAELNIDANTLYIKKEEVEGTIESITATSDGLSTGICDKDDKIKNVTSGDAEHIVSLVVDRDTWNEIEMGEKYILKVAANGYVFQILSTGTAIKVNGVDTITVPANSRLVVNKILDEEGNDAAVTTVELVGTITKPTS